MSTFFVAENVKLLPEELRAVRRWIPWRFGPPPRDNPNAKPRKLPVSLLTGRPCNACDSRYWYCLQEVTTALQKWPGKYTGLGFVLGEGWLGIDLDDCIDAAGKLRPAAREVVGLLPESFWEISPSGTGLKCIVRGKKPGVNCRATAPWGGKIEMYDEPNRYFTVTANIFQLEGVR